jgi:hypothetical protein
MGISTYLPEVTNYAVMKSIYSVGSWVGVHWGDHR